MTAASVWLSVAAWAATALAASATEGQTGNWGDQGDGTYRNPILAADFSDPDVIRVGADYYLVTSTFESSPGVTVLHSRDLVNWEIIGAAFTDLTQLGADFSALRMRSYNEGIYAPSIRYHAGRFWIFVNCHGGEGFFQAQATNPAGPWTVTQLQDKHGAPLRTRGWTDPCPFWDADGKAYLAASRPSAKWFSYLFQMTPDGTRLLDAELGAMQVKDVVYAYPDGGTVISPFHSSEGNKIYQRNGFYYLQHIEFTDRGQGHGTYLFRSRHLYGSKADGTAGGPGDPGTYESLKFGEDIPGQGGLVDTPDGRWFWIGQNNHVGADGRTPHLLPVTWVDEWPVPGVAVQQRTGAMAWHLPLPITGQPTMLPQRGDDFSASVLAPFWQWNHQPQAAAWSLTERPGFLRLRACKPLTPGRFFSIPNLLNQRYCRSRHTENVVRIELAGMIDGQEAGLARFNGGKQHARIGVVQHGATRSLTTSEDQATSAGPALPAGTTAIWLRSQVEFAGVNAFGYSLDGHEFVPFGGQYRLRSGNYRGDMVGIYTCNEIADGGYIDIDSFTYDIDHQEGKR